MSEVKIGTATFTIDAAFLKTEARAALRSYFAPLTFVWRFLRRAGQQEEEMDELLAKVARMVSEYPAEHPLAHLEAEAIAERIVALVREAPPPCEICQKPADVVRCGDCDHYANMED